MRSRQSGESGRYLIRVAMVSDIHGNQTALEAVLADLRQSSPDLIPHGGVARELGKTARHWVGFAGR